MEIITSYCDQLIDYLHPYFEHKRYVLVRGNAQFKRETNFGFSSVLCSISGDAHKSYVRFFVGLRHDLIERNLVGLFGQGDYYRSGSHTLLVDARKLGWTSTGSISCPHDLELEADLFIDFMDRKGFGFLDTYRRLTSCDHLFNRQQEKSAEWSNQQYQRCFRAMAIAHVLKRPDLEQLFEKHRTYLVHRGFSGEIIRKFDINFARSRQPSLN